MPPHSLGAAHRPAGLPEDGQALGASPEQGRPTSWRFFLVIRLDKEHQVNTKLPLQLLGVRSDSSASAGLTAPSLPSLAGGQHGQEAPQSRTTPQGKASSKG